MTFFHDPSRRLIVYDRPSDLVAANVEGARAAGQYLAVPQTLRNSQVLRHLNYPVPPIMDGYDWPCRPGITPYESQKLSANFKVLHPRCFDLSDMGTGKSLPTLWAADWLMSQHPPKTCRALIVAPLSILRSVWGSNIRSNLMGRRTFEVLHGDANKRRKLLDADVDFYIINFDGVGVGAHTRKRFELDGFSLDLAQRSDIRIAIVDEASGYRDASTKRHKIAREVIGKRDYLWMLTGTPTPNAPTDAYGLGKMLHNAYGESFRGFQERTMTKVSQYVWKPRRDGYDTARKFLTPAIRFSITDVWDGPPLTTQQRDVALTVAQIKALAALKKDLALQVSSGKTITAANEAAARLKLLQIVMGAVYDENHKAHAIDAEPRIGELESVIEATSHKVLVFCPLTSVVNLLYARLHKRWGVGVINGAVKEKDRAAIIQQFVNDDNMKVMVVDPQATAHGINDFVVADTAVWYGPTDKTELYQQGNKRVHRPGQKWPTTIIQLVSTKTERAIFSRLETNTTMQGLLLDMVRGEL